MTVRPRPASPGLPTNVETDHPPEGAHSHAVQLCGRLPRSATPGAASMPCNGDAPKRIPRARPRRVSGCGRVAGSAGTVAAARRVRRRAAGAGGSGCGCVGRGVGLGLGGRRVGRRSGVGSGRRRRRRRRVVGSGRAAGRRRGRRWRLELLAGRRGGRQPGRARGDPAAARSEPRRGDALGPVVDRTGTVTTG